VKRFLILALLLTTPLWCATLERLSLEEMAAKSTAIVRGKVTGTSTAMTSGIIYTHYQIAVSETFKGPSGNSVEIMVPGGTLDGVHQTFAGSPTLNTGDEFVFFLWTKSGITWITGLTQGLFNLAADSTTDPSARRPASRELMLDPKTGREVKDTVMSMRLSELRARISAALAKGGAQ
jgi:hypothetical protein